MSRGHRRSGWWAVYALHSTVSSRCPLLSVRRYRSHAAARDLLNVTRCVCLLEIKKSVLKQWKRVLTRTANSAWQVWWWWWCPETQCACCRKVACDNWWVHFIQNLRSVWERVHVVPHLLKPLRIFITKSGHFFSSGKTCFQSDLLLCLNPCLNYLVTASQQFLSHAANVSDLTSWPSGPTGLSLATWKVIWITSKHILPVLLNLHFSFSFGSYRVGVKYDNSLVME